ncbi:MAG TPA: two-component regulator propeller domain-containing protein [Longimicrobiales bacterium]|nr:two-component regulator propeller domain-containing protein [Longimicrobiales bacterium]
MMPLRSTATAAGTLLAAVVLVACALQASAQGRFGPAFTTYGTAEGMVNPRVVSLLQDSSGFLWIGTHGGLLRFDGRGFQAYRARLQGPTTRADDFITALASAPGGRIWVGADRGGLRLFDPVADSVRHFPLTEDVLGPWRRDVAEETTRDRPGRLVADILPLPNGPLLLRTDVGLVRFDPTSQAVENLIPSWDGDVPLPHATAVCLGADGRALITLSDGSLAWVDAAGAPSPVPLVLPDSVGALRPTGNGYLATSFEAVGYSLPRDLSSYREVFRLPPTIQRRALRDVLVLPDGRAWVATTRGAYLADPADGTMQRVGDGEGARSLPDQEVSALALDRTGILWMGTWNGLASLHPQRSDMARLFSGTDVEGDGVVAFVDAGPGRVWLGAMGSGGVQLFDARGRGGWGAVSRPASLEPLRESMVLALAGGGDGPLWIAAFSDGLWVMDGDVRARKIPVLGPDGAERSETAYFVFVDRAGDVWAGTYSLGLVRLDRARQAFLPFRGSDPRNWDLGSNWVWPIAEDSQGRLWVGAYNGGLSMVSADRASATLHSARQGGLSDERILTVFVDSRDFVWAGTEGGGLNRLDPTTGDWTTWTTEEGLPHDVVEGIEEDLLGRIWISTHDGLARLDLGTGEMVVLREPAGLAGNAFLANAAHRDPEGMLYFGGSAGVTILDPSAIASQGTPPYVALTAFRIQGREAPLARALRTDLLDLEPNENFFAFEFAAMDFADVSQNRYRYRLEGLDPDWVDAGTEPVANYTSVPPGRYTFRVAARNSDGMWNMDALAIPLRVQAPFYKTFWFQSLAVVALLSLVAGFYTYRLRQLEARQRLRLEIAGKLHDDIGANLSTIALKAEMVRGAHGLDDRRSAQLADVGRLARDTATKVRETVWVVNTKYDTVAGLVGKMHDTADTLLAGVIPFGFTAPEQVPERKISMETRQNVHLLFKETLNNVAKHASASRVEVTVTLTGGNVLAFRVVDDGMGFDPAHAREGNGQRLMRQRAEALRGTLRVESAPGAGTTVEFTARLR